MNVYEELKESYKFKGQGFEAIIGKSSGVLESYSYESVDLIKSPLKFNFWRAPTDNDLGILDFAELTTPSYDISWKTAEKGRSVKDIKLKKIGTNAIRLEVHSQLVNTQDGLTTFYTLYGDGNIIVENEFTPTKNLVRFGMHTSLEGEFNQLTWFGRGPHETMLDRKTGAAIGVYSDFIENLIHHYIRPQENGNRTDVRWATLTNQNGFGLLVSHYGNTNLNVSAWPYMMEDLESATHINEIPKRDIVTFNIDYKQQGVGGDIPGVAMLHNAYKLKSMQKYRYSFRLRGYSEDLGTKSAVAKRKPPL